MAYRTAGPPPGWEPTDDDVAGAHRILDGRSGDGPVDSFLAGVLIATLRIVAEENPPASLPPGSAKAIRVAFALADAAHPDDTR